MKILFSSDTFLPSTNGTAYFLYQFAGELKRRGHDVYVIAPSKSSRIESYTLDNGINVYGIPSLKVYFYPDMRYPVPIGLELFIQRYLKKVRPDVVHIQHHFFIGKATFNVAQRYGIPTLGTNHFMPDNILAVLKLPQSIRKRIYPLAWKQMIDMYKQIDAVTTPTEIGAKVLKQVGFPKKVTPISNGINLERFNPKKPSAEIYKRYKIPQGKKIVLFVGRIDAEKRIHVLVEAMSGVVKLGNAHLVLAGKGMVRERLEEQVSELGIKKNVTFTGYVKDADLPDIYRTASLFVMPGDAELQSIATLEALATGLPVIAANAVALPLLVENGKNGYLFKPGSVAELSSLISKVVYTDGLIEKMGKESLKVAKKHDIKLITNKFEELYKDVSKKRKVVNWDKSFTSEYSISAIKKRITNSALVKKIEDLDNRIKSLI